MSHMQYQEMLSAHLDGVLSPEEEADLKSHLDGCPECRAELENLRQTVQLLQMLPAVPLPADFSHNLRRHLAAEGKTWATVPVPVRKSKGLPLRLSKSPWITLAAAAAVILMVWTAAQPPRLSGTQADLASVPAAQQEAATTEPSADTDSTDAIMAAAVAETAEAPVAEEKPEAIPAEKRAAAEKLPAVKTEAGNSSPVADGLPKQPAAAETAIAAADTPPPAVEEQPAAEEQAGQGLAAAATDASPAAEKTPEPAAEATPETEATLASPRAPADDGNRAMISPTLGPKIIRSARITLTAAEGSGEDIAAKLAAAYTVKASDPTGTGQISFLVPIESWDKAMILLEELGIVSDLSFSENDISEEYEMISEHLMVLRQEAVALEGMLTEDLEAADRQDLEIQLHQLDADAASLEAQLAFMDDKVANIDVRLKLNLETTESSE